MFLFTVSSKIEQVLLKMDRRIETAQVDAFLIYICLNKTCHCTVKSFVDETVLKIGVFAGV